MKTDHVIEFTYAFAPYLLDEATIDIAANWVWERMPAGTATMAQLRESIAALVPAIACATGVLMIPDLLPGTNLGILALPPAEHVYPMPPAEYQDKTIHSAALSAIGLAMQRDLKRTGHDVFTFKGREGGELIVFRGEVTATVLQATRVILIDPNSPDLPPELLARC